MNKIVRLVRSLDVSYKDSGILTLGFITLFVSCQRSLSSSTGSLCDLLKCERF
ncbi:hypothetical protein [Calothrix sp. NIES-2100]|uniref:hypothetical protein n=1 Tax=Calothrix sp. NIES-2100 TaxID=1954172 RepID=UPI0030D9212C